MAEKFDISEETAEEHLIQLRSQGLLSNELVMKEHSPDWKENLETPGDHDTIY